MNTTAFDCSICDPLTGACREDLGLCLCRPYWGGETCSDNMIAGNNQLAAYMLAHTIIFCVIFGAILAFGLAEIIILFKTSKDTVNKPTLFMFLTVSFVGLERVIFLAVMRYGQVKEIPYVASTLLEGFVIWAIVFMHFMVGLFWLSAFISTKPKKKHILRRIRIAIIVLAIFFLMVEVARDVLFGTTRLTLRETVPIFIVLQIMFFLVIVPSSIALLVLGTKLTKELKKFKDISKARRRLITRINNFAKTIAATVICVVFILTALRIVNVTTERSYPAVGLAILSINRVMEAIYCFMILITYHRTVKTPEQSTSSQNAPSTNPASENADDVHLNSR